MTEFRSKRVLIGIDAIMTYLGISEPTFKKFIRLGMPARVIDNRCRRWTPKVGQPDGWDKL